jgi:hypothetical protein
VWGDNELGHLGIKKSPSLGKKGTSGGLFDRDFRKYETEDGIWECGELVCNERHSVDIQSSYNEKGIA